MRGLFSGGGGGGGGLIIRFLRYLLEFGKNMRDLCLQGIGKMFVEPFLSVAGMWAGFTKKRVNYPHRGIH